MAPKAHVFNGVWSQPMALLGSVGTIHWKEGCYLLMCPLRGMLGLWTFLFLYEADYHHGALYHWRPKATGLSDHG